MKKLPYLHEEHQIHSHHTYQASTMEVQLKQTASQVWHQRLALDRMIVT